MQEIIGSKSNSLAEKLIVLGVCGSIAAVKSFELARELIRCGARVQIVASRAALEIIGEKSLEFATQKKVIKEITGKIEHIKFFGKQGKADLLLIAPATANTISKIAMGIDDTPITTFATAAIGVGVPVLIAPAMHEQMYSHPIVKENLSKLQKNNKVQLIKPLVEEEKAKLSPIKSIILDVEAAFCKKPLSKKKVLILTGTTKEKIDPVRVLTTLASGKTGEELAKEAFRRGAQVTLLHNKDSFFPQIKNIKYSSANDLFKKTLKELETGYDYFFSPAAISDFAIKENKNKFSSSKEKSIKLVPRKKLVLEVRKKFPKLFIGAFKALSNVSKAVLEKESRSFLTKNKFNMVIGNDVEKYGFGNDKNEILITLEHKKSVSFSGKKELIAKKILDFVN